MNVWNSVRHYIAPSQENVYRPHLLGRSWLVFFFAVTLAVEGFLVSGLVAQQNNGTFLTAAITSHVFQDNSLAGTTQEMHSIVQSTARQLTQTMDNPDFANAILGSVGSLLFIVVILTFVVHIDVQPRDALLGGMVVATIALLCVAANIHFLSGSTPKEAAGISALAP